MVNLRVTSAAEVDFTESLVWYAEKSVRAAEGFDKEFQRVLALIAKDPKACPQCDERHRICRMRGYPFQVIFRELPDEVAIIAVAHSSRNPNYWLGR